MDSPRPAMIPDLTVTAGRSSFALLSTRKGTRVIGQRPDQGIEPGDCLHVVAENIGSGVQDCGDGVPISAKIRYEHLDPAPGGFLADGSNGPGKMSRASVRQIVPGDRCDYRVFEVKDRNRVRNFRGLFGPDRSVAPVCTPQNLQALVQTPPRIRNVAVPLPQHSPRLGHRASVQTVWSFFSLTSDLIFS